MGGSAGANLTAGMQLLGTDPLWSGLSSGLGFSSSDAESNGVGGYLRLPGFGPWALASERYLCCRDDDSRLLLIWAAQSRSTSSAANKLYLLSRKVLERCSKICGEGSQLLLPPCSPVDAWAPVSPLLWEDGPLLSREVPACHSLAGAATNKPSYPFLMLPVLRKPGNGTFLQGSTGGCLSPGNARLPALRLCPPCPPPVWWESCDSLCPKELLV